MSSLLRPRPSRFTNFNSYMMVLNVNDTTLKLKKNYRNENIQLYFFVFNIMEDSKLSLLKNDAIGFRK